MTGGDAPAGGTAGVADPLFDATSSHASGLRACVHCGICLAVCPTYRQLGQEMDSPRGRLYLIRAAVDGRLDPGPGLARHLDLCVGCLACETACPAGVPFGSLLEAARAGLERRGIRRRAGWITWAALGVFPHRTRARAVFALARAWQASGLADLAERAGLLDRWPRLGALARALPRLTPLQPVVERVEARGRRRGRVGLLTGCVQPHLTPGVGRAAALALARAGWEVVAPRGQGCCGALELHAGRRDAFAGRVTALAAAFPAELDYVVSTAAGCGAALRGAGARLDDPRARAFVERVRDVTELLADAELPFGPLPTGSSATSQAVGSGTSRAGSSAASQTVRSGASQAATSTTPRAVATYHDPCHLAHGQRVRQEPRALLARIPGLTLVPLADSETCCGSAGIYNLQEPEMAGRLLAAKLARIRETGASIVVTGNPGCMLQIAAGCRSAGLAVDVLHPVEVVARALAAGETA